MRYGSINIQILLNVSFFNFSIFKLLQIYRMIMDNRANKRNTFRPGNLLIASAALLLMMVSMGYTFPFVNQDQKSGISVYNVKWFSTDVGIVSFDNSAVRRRS